VPLIAEHGLDIAGPLALWGEQRTLMAAIGTPIDATSFQLLGQLDRLIDDRFKPKSLVLVGFDLIADPGCRAYFYGMATAWALPRQQVEDLIALGEAMVLQSPRYRQFVAALDEPENPKRASQRPRRAPSAS